MKSLRNYMFRVKDRMNGRRFALHFEDITRIMDDYASKISVDLRNKHLNDILNHAVKTTPFYRNLNIKPDLENFPVINKTLIRNNFESFRSDVFRDKPFIKMTTSGSTGTPFTIYQDLNKKTRNYADTLYFANLAGYELGDKLYYFKIWSENNRISLLKARLQNTRPFDVLNLSDGVLEGLFKELKKVNGRISFLGYASAFDAIVKYLKKTNASPLSGKVRSVIAISESLSLETREEMSRYFGSPVVSRYSNLENGILAQQCAHHNEFHLNAASYFVEIFDMDRDEPAPAGVQGRIVVSSFFNYSMPLIRYDTGDVGAFSSSAECEFNTPVLTGVEGRKLDLIYDTRGNLISSYIVYKNMWKYVEINQYQLVQEGQEDYRIILNPAGHFTREKELVSEFKSYLGQEAKIIVEYVSEIPVLRSGKRKKVVNLWKNQ